MYRSIWPHFANVITSRQLRVSQVMDRVRSIETWGYNSKSIPKCCTSAVHMIWLLCSSTIGNSAARSGIQEGKNVVVDWSYTSPSRQNSTKEVENCTRLTRQQKFPCISAEVYVCPNAEMTILKNFSSYQMILVPKISMSGEISDRQYSLVAVTLKK